RPLLLWKNSARPPGRPWRRSKRPPAIRASTSSGFPNGPCRRWIQAERRRSQKPKPAKPKQSQNSSHMIRRYLVLAAIVVASSLSAAADEPAALDVKALAAKVRPSIVVITFAGREGGQQGLGTGFVIDKSGLIATNLHVIGEARPISVQTADGQSLAVKAVHASDRALDLAILQVE